MSDCSIRVSECSITVPWFHSITKCETWSTGLVAPPVLHTHLYMAYTYTHYSIKHKCKKSSSNAFSNSIANLMEWSWYLDDQMWLVLQMIIPCTNRDNFNFLNRQQMHTEIQGNHHPDLMVYVRLMHHHYGMCRENFDHGFSSLCYHNTFFYSRHNL